MWNVGGGVVWCGAVRWKRVDTSDLTLIPDMIHNDVFVHVFHPLERPGSDYVHVLVFYVWYVRDMWSPESQA